MNIQAKIQVIENNDETQIKGSYQEMVDILSSIKRLGFRWNAMQRVWTMPTANYKGKVEEKILKLIGKQDNASEQREETNKQTLQEILNKFKTLQVCKITETANGFDLAGPYDITYPLANELRSAGGSWQANKAAYTFDIRHIKAKELQNVAEKIIEADKRYATSLEVKRSLAEAFVKESPLASCITIGINKNNLVFYTPRGYNEIIKNIFNRIKWDGSSWVFPIASLKENGRDLIQFKTEVESLKAQQDQATLKQKEREEEEAKKVGGYFTFSTGSGYNPYFNGWKVGDVFRNKDSRIAQGEPEWLYVVKSESRYFREDGLSFGVGDDRGYVYSCKARPAQPAEYALENQKHQKKITDQELKKQRSAIIDSIQKPSNLPSGSGLNPIGEIYWIDKKNVAYGGGSWFIVGQDGIWYVQNNGSDGADWGNNNIATGGAGAIGWRVPYDAALANQIKEITNQLNS